MKLEHKFFNAFFYPFLCGIILSIGIVTTILTLYSNNFLDKQSAKDIYSIEKKYATINLNSVNVLLSNALLKIQVGLHEQITFYQNIASQIQPNEKESRTIQQYTIPVVEIKDFNPKPADLDYYSIWFVNRETNTAKINENKTSNLYQQLSVYSNIIQSLYSVLSSMSDILLDIYFLFDDTDLYIGYPFTYFNSSGINDAMQYFDGNPVWCTDEDGNVIDYYKFKCRGYYVNMQKSCEDMFDNNINDQKDRKIFISTPYAQFGVKEQILFTMCIKFNDTVSKDNAYICGDILLTNLFNSFDNFNEKLLGYFAITSVGFNNAFYFPQMNGQNLDKTIAEFIFSWDIDYYLQEKLNFVQKTLKILTSNYNQKIDKNKIENDPISIFDEINVTDNQTFMINGIEYDFSLFPILLENYEKKYEHVLSIVYIYNKKLFYDHMLSYQSSGNNKMILQIVLFVLFGSILLYLVVLAFRLLAKYIVIPIKNVQYMLEGINVGGENRIDYINKLKKKQEESLNKLNRINKMLKKKKNLDINKNNNNLVDNDSKGQILNPNSKENDPIEKNLNNNNDFILKHQNSLNPIKEDIDNEETKSDNNINNNMTNNYNNNANFNNNKSEIESKMNMNDDKLGSTRQETEESTFNLDYNTEFINSKDNYDEKYDLEGEIIEKEENFYDFDEELLQYRPIEIDHLVQSLLNLKSALILTSSEQGVEKIIGYSNSEQVFNSFKNKEGACICQSNIGNLQSQLLIYDKSIYHLALSLQNVELKKFLSTTLSDEYDESNSLLQKIEMKYNEEENKNLNKLAQAQQNSKNKNFSQKIIGILINSRYNKLILIYYKFFSFIQKKNYNYEDLEGLFMHTEFHKFEYYHKIIIQYVYLCLVSNDSIKIGESILDYIEFLIKFKLKTSKENKDIITKYSGQFPQGIEEKQKTKEKYFNKILRWFLLFDSYVNKEKNKLSFENNKSILDAYSHNMGSNSSHNENTGTQSEFLFQVNLQRGDFLKGKFAYACKNYSDAVYYFIQAAKKKSDKAFVMDGLIKKRALRRIAKIAKKVEKKIKNNNFSNLYINATINKIDNIVGNNKMTIMINDSNINNNLINLSTSINNESLIETNNNANNKNGTANNNNSNGIINNDIKFKDEIKKIIEVINKDISECNAKQLKDVIIILDANRQDKNTFETYVDATKTIINNYLANNDRVGVIYLKKKYKIICPMLPKNELDFKNLSDDLKAYIDNFKENSIDEGVKAKFNNDENNEELHSERGSLSFEEQELSMKSEDDFSLDDTIKSINFCINYIKGKGLESNEKFMILFSNIFNDSSSLSDKCDDLYQKRDIHLLIVGKTDNVKEDNNDDDEKSREEFLKKFGKKSEFVPSGNMKKIKNILSCNKIINDNITFPNEVYK